MCEKVPAVDVKTITKLAFDEDSSDFDWFSSDSSDDSNLVIPPRSKRIRVQKFEEVIEEYSDEEFRKHFRLSRTTSNVCINNLENANVLPTHSSGREKVSARKSFLMTLWYLSNQETYRQVSDRFDVTGSAAWKIIRTVIDYLVSISATVIKWPSDEEATKIEKEFAKKQGIKHVVGCIDGSHILINRKCTSQHAYCNRKGTHSIIIQGVVDNNKKFIDVFCGEPGSLHDARVFKRSSLYRKATDGTLQFHNRFLLGDSAYPTTLNWLVTPFKDNGNLTPDQKIFNFKHSSTRIVVENAYALLKGRFRRLRYFEHKDIQFIVKCVVAACTLHNICIDSFENTDDTDIYVEDDYEEEPEDNHAEGMTRREEVFRNLTCNDI